MKLIIFMNGAYCDQPFYQQYLKRNKTDYIICADGGANAAKELGVQPDVILGDMDSITEETKAFYKDVRFKCYPTKKDQTDGEIAIEHAIESGAKKVTILGGLGSRFDHTLANVYLMIRLLDAGIKAEMVDVNNCIQLIGAEKEAKFCFPVGTRVSLLPIGGDVEALTIEGFEYPIVQGSMTATAPYGVSNVTHESQQRIRCQKGMLLIITSME